MISAMIRKMRHHVLSLTAALSIIVLLLIAGCVPTPPSQEAARTVCGPPWTRETLDHAGQDLSMQDFSARHLRNADFTGAKLRQTNFANSCFSGTPIFKGVDAEGANFSNTALWADFTGANLKEASFRGAWLGQSYFDKADLRGARLTHTSSSTTVFFRNADLRKTDFSSSKLLGVFVGADLRDAVFRNADLTMVDFNAANLKGADMRGATMTERTAASARAANADLSEIKLVPELDAATCGHGCNKYQ